MDRIFGTASSVIFWLGELHNDHRLIVDVLNWIHVREVIETRKDNQDLTADRLRSEEKVASKLSHTLESEHGVTAQQLQAFALLVRVVYPKRQREGRQRLERALEHPSVTSIRSDLFPPKHVFWELFLAFMDYEWFRKI